MCNRATLHDVAAIRGHRAMLGVFVMFKNLAAIPSIVGYPRRCIVGCSTMLCDDRARSCNGRAMVMR